MSIKMTRAQCRGARALMDMTQPQLADAAKLGLSTIVDFERDRRQVSDDAILAMQTALARSGVEFIDENGGGPGVRLRKGVKNKTGKK
jgi:transcriptional regulator with XRE-family HTH domain